MQRIDRGPIYRQKSIQKSRYFLIPNRHRLNRDQRDDHIIFAPIPSLKNFQIMTLTGKFITIRNLNANI